jgi:hypothetical protein
MAHSLNNIGLTKEKAKDYAGAMAAFNRWKRLTKKTHKDTIT